MAAKGNSYYFFRAFVEIEDVKMVLLAAGIWLEEGRSKQGIPDEKGEQYV